jgi:hypothetical protein
MLDEIAFALVLITPPSALEPPPLELADPEPTLAHTVPLAASSVFRSLLNLIKPAVFAPLVAVLPTGTFIEFVLVGIADRFLFFEAIFYSVIKL